MILRIARHTNQLAALETFYTQVLGLSVLGRFAGHDGYDGVFLGKEGLHWHIEFTQSTAPAQHTPDADDLLVLYPTNQAEYDALLQRIEAAGIATHTPTNPYWQRNGLLVHDPDGFGVVVSAQKLA